MKKLSVRLLSLLLCFALCLTLLPSAALAAETERAQDRVESFVYIEPSFRSLISEEQLRDLLDAQSSAASALAPEASEPVTSVEAAGLVLREAMVKREASVSISVQLPEEADDLYLQVYERALEHTGNPTEGDYLRYNIPIVSGSVWENGGASYTLNFSLMCATTPAQEQEMNEAVAALLAELSLDGKSDLNKLDAVYRYVTDNVKYDYAHLNNPRYLLQFSAYAALVNKTAVCQGYAGLMYRLLLELGMDSRVITSEDHAWNIVRLDGEDWYYNIDATWDAGTSGKYYNYLMGLYTFGYSHPEEERFQTEDFRSRFPVADGDRGPTGEPLPLCGVLGSNLTWYISDDTLHFVGEGPMENLTRSSAPWEHYKSRIKRLDLPEGITSIGESCFERCTGLTELSIPDSVTVIGPSAFKECYYITKLHLGQNVKTISENAFAYLTDLEELSLPESVETVGDYAFQRCRALKELKLNEGLLAIGEYLLYECTGIEELTIPASVTEIGVGLSYWCSSLKNIYVAEGSESFTSVDGVLLSKDLSRLLAYPDAREGDYTAPEGVRSIDECAFEGTDQLSVLTLPKTLERLGDSAFLYSNLTALCFQGDAPLLEGDSFDSIGAAGYYPRGNTSWNDAFFSTCPGMVWMPWTPGESLPEEHEHVWVDPGWLWSEDYRQATAVFRCQDDPEHALSYETSTSCEEQAEGFLYTAALTMNEVEYTDSKLLEAEAHRHEWGYAPIWSWAEDYSSATATFVCESDESHKVTVPARVWREEQVKGVLYTAEASYDHSYPSDRKLVPFDELPEQHVHEWSEPTWTWADDGRIAVATFVCLGDARHEVTVKARVSSEEQDDGILYTATLFFVDKNYSDTKLVDPNSPAPHVHDWGEPVWVWADDASSATATFTCQSDASHVVEVSAGIDAEKQEGGVLYTATADFNGKSYSDTKFIPGDAPPYVGLPGDANGDGVVNGKDAIRLAQYLADWPVEIDLDAMDVNGDGTVNGKDAIRLAQYLADWPVELK